MIDDISPPGSWVRELSARPHTYRDVWAALREAEARIAAVEAERDALRAAIQEAIELRNGYGGRAGSVADEMAEGLIDAAREAT